MSNIFTQILLLYKRFFVYLSKRIPLMKLTRIILLAALLLATGTTASAQKPSRLEKYKPLENPFI